MRRKWAVYGQRVERLKFLKPFKKASSAEELTLRRYNAKGRRAPSEGSECFIQAFFVETKVVRKDVECLEGAGRQEAIDEDVRVGMKLQGLKRWEKGDIWIKLDQSCD